ncbi:MAG TPA: GDSL-type esterase/lipase family protein, partial [Stellaceae bacterium]|nr:GDSL-type esterase/lipase family protein [Stellaceae bacterium]
DARLPHLRARLAARQPVEIVAIGGASTAGKAAGSPDLAYPRRLQEALARDYPALPIAVVNRGVPRQSAEDMLARFPRDVLAAHPVLVIWEVGITDAVRGTDVDDFAATLQSGVDQLEQRGIDVMFVNMQFSRDMTAIIDFDEYLRALRRVAEINGLSVFPRFEMMRHWSEAGVFNFDGVAPAERARLAARVYRCIGDALADAIRRAVR